MKHIDTLYYRVPGDPDPECRAIVRALPTLDWCPQDWYRPPSRHWDRDNLSDLLSYVAGHYYRNSTDPDEAEWPLEFHFYETPDPGPGESPYYTATVNIRYVARFDAVLSEPPRVSKPAKAKAKAKASKPDPPATTSAPAPAVPTAPADLGITREQARDAYLTGKKVRYWDTKDHPHYGWYRDGFVGDLRRHGGLPWLSSGPPGDHLVLVKAELPKTAPDPDRPERPDIYSVGPPFPLARCQVTDDPPCPVRAAAVAAYEAENQARLDMEYRAQVVLAEGRERDDYGDNWEDDE